MAKIFVAGNMLTIKAGITAEQVKECEDFMPDVLVAEDEDGEPIFKIGIGGESEVNQYGIQFVNAGGALSASVEYTPPSDSQDELKEDIARKYGRILADLEAIEQSVMGAIDNIDARKELIKENITII